MWVPHGPWKPPWNQADGRHGATAVRIAQANLLAAACWFSSTVGIFIILYVFTVWNYGNYIHHMYIERYIYIPLYIHLCSMYMQYSDPATAIQLNLKPYDLIPKRWWLYRGVLCQCFLFQDSIAGYLVQASQAYLPNLVDFFFRSEHCCLSRRVRIFYPKRFDVLRC